MSEVRLERATRDFLRGAARRNKARLRTQTLPPLAAGGAGFVLAMLPLGHPDLGAFIIGAALAWGVYFLLRPLRRRSEQRFYELETARFQQAIAAKELSLPGALAQLLKSSRHKDIARALVERLPGGPDLIDETAAGAVWFATPGQPAAAIETPKAQVETAVAAAPAKPEPAEAPSATILLDPYDEEEEAPGPAAAVR